MEATDTRATASLLQLMNQALEQKDYIRLTELVAPIAAETLADTLGRLGPVQRAIVYRFLPKEKAMTVFENLAPGLQGDLIRGLQDREVAAIFADLEPDDRVWLLDELPAALAPRLLQGLSYRERQLTADVLGYPKGSVGRRMSPEYISTRANCTVAETLARVQARINDAETIYTLPVLDNGRRVIGVVSLRDLLSAPSNAAIAEVMQPAETESVYLSAEAAARRCTDLRILALPIVDREGRLVGILTIDDAVRILELAETEDVARQGGAEPLRRPYLATPVRSLVSSRVVWLLVLAIGATLTVQVLSIFEGALAEVTILALFIPLLIGTGGNTGNQAATTVTRALALGEVAPNEIWQVVGREFRTGLLLGTVLGLLGGTLTALIYSPEIGLVIGFTLVAICTTAATVGGAMPIVARALKVDPAVFSNPFITTFVDATGLVIYFLIARQVLGL